MAVLGVVALLLGAFVVVQIVDPRLGERTPPEVNFSEPPNEVAADSAAQFKYVDYTYRIDFRRNRSEEWRQVRTMKVDHTDREYYKTGPAGERGLVLYGTDAVAFMRPTPNSSWRTTFYREVVYHPSTTGVPFLIDRMRSSDASIISQDRSTVMIRVETHPLNVARELPGNATLRINRETGLIESANVTYKPQPSQTLYLQFRLTETDTDVRRPKGVRFSVMELILDLFRGPVVNL